MMNDPMNRYELATAQQREVWKEAEQDRQAKEATHDQPSLIERILQTVWKRLGLPAQEPTTGPTTAPSGELPTLSASMDG